MASDTVVSRQFAANLLRILEAREMTQMDLVRATKERQSTINAICSGRHAPRIGIVTRIADALKVKTDDLIISPSKEALSKPSEAA